MKKPVPFLSAAILACAAAAPVGAFAQTIEVSPAVQHDHLPSLRGVMPQPDLFSDGKKHVREVKSIPHLSAPGNAVDNAVQGSPTQSPAAATTPGVGIAGVGDGDYSFVPNAAPPDTNGAIGATQYVQWVNESFAVFDKAGNKVYGPVNGNTLWKGFGGGCEANNDGDPIVKWDNAGQRWVMMQFSVTTTPYLQCVAVSTTADATGGWNRYAFTYSDFPDYPKAGVWSNAYFVTFNMFRGGTTFSGARVCAYDRTAMLAGLPATQQCTQLSTSFGGLLPADPDGASTIAAGAPNYLMNFTGGTTLNLWKYRVDFTNPANSTFTGPTAIPVNGFTAACSGGTCIPQGGTSNALDSLADRLMYRLAYRKFADGHESLLVTHSVNATDATRRKPHTAVRWYELHLAGGTASVYQQGTYQPDALSRWMGSAAFDKLGNIAVGYSTSSASTFPSIAVSTRAPADLLGTLSNELVVKAGGGSQTGNLHRWGDYSSMVVDPVDDCTFWYTTEYLKASGSFNWSTWISSFKVNGCQ